MATDAPAPVVIGGVPYVLRLTLGAFRLASLHHGTTVTVGEIGEVSMEILPRLVWIAMLPTNPDLTEDEAVRALAQDPDAEEAAVEAVLPQLVRAARLLGRMGDASEGAPSGK